MSLSFFSLIESFNLVKTINNKRFYLYIKLIVIIRKEDLNPRKHFKMSIELQLSYNNKRFLRKQKCRKEKAYLQG